MKSKKYFFVFVFILNTGVSSFASCPSQEFKSVFVVAQDFSARSESLENLQAGKVDSIELCYNFQEVRSHGNTFFTAQIHSKGNEALGEMTYDEFAETLSGLRKDFRELWGKKIIFRETLAAVEAGALTLLTVGTVAKLSRLEAERLQPLAHVFKQFIDVHENRFVRFILGSSYLGAIYGTFRWLEGVNDHLFYGRDWKRREGLHRILELARLQSTPEDAPAGEQSTAQPPGVLFLRVENVNQVSRWFKLLFTKYRANPLDLHLPALP